MFPSNDALFLHPPISAKECAVCVSSRKPKTPIMVSCPAASSSHSFTQLSPTLYLSTDDMLNLEGMGWGDQSLFGEARASSQASPLSRTAFGFFARGSCPFCPPPPPSPGLAPPDPSVSVCCPGQPSPVPAGLSCKPLEPCSTHPVSGIPLHTVEFLEPRSTHPEQCGGS